MVCPVCNSKTKAGNPCKKHTCKFAPKCSSHTKVAVKGSNIPGAGKGLFARGDIKKGEIIADYKVGTNKMNHAQFINKYPSGRPTHVWSPSNGVYFDAFNLNKSVAGAANRGSGNSNSMINGGGKMVTKTAIKKGVEILVNYGSSYRL